MAVHPSYPVPSGALPKGRREVLAGVGGRGRVLCPEATEEIALRKLEQFREIRAISVEWRGQSQALGSGWWGMKPGRC